MGIRVFSERRSAGLRKISLGLVLFGALVPLHGQSTSGTILGTVKDPSGRAVTTVKVELLNKGTDARRAALTNDEGDFRFSDIEAGSYVLTLEAPGFQREEFSQFDLLARETSGSTPR
jgi:Carboxypeptidase regulatory-like domain